MIDGVYVVGASMTAFGRHPAKALEDLGAEAALGALQLKAQCAPERCRGN